MTGTPCFPGQTTERFTLANRSPAFDKPSPYYEVSQLSNPVALAYEKNSWGSNLTLPPLLDANFFESRAFPPIVLVRFPGTA